jgi:predicted MPP superfamily phosphohydrolase
MLLQQGYSIMAKQQLNESVEKCKSVFVSWTWLIGILAGLFITGISIAWTASAKMTTIDNTLVMQNTRLYSVEIQLAKTDTIIKILKELQQSNLSYKDR